MTPRLSTKHCPLFFFFFQMNKYRQYRDDDVTIMHTHILTRDQVVLIRLWNKLAACRHHVSEHILQNPHPLPCVTSPRTTMHLWTTAVGSRDLSPPPRTCTINTF